MCIFYNKNVWFEFEDTKGWWLLYYRGLLKANAHTNWESYKQALIDGWVVNADSLLLQISLLEGIFNLQKQKQKSTRKLHEKEEWYLSRIYLCKDAVVRFNIC